MYTKSSILSLLALALTVSAQSGWGPSDSLRIRDLEDGLSEALYAREILLAREAEAEAEAELEELFARYAEADALPNPWALAYPDADAYNDDAYNGYSLEVRGVGDPAPPDANGNRYCLEQSGSVCRKVNPAYKAPSAGSGGGFSGGLGSPTLAGGVRPRIGTTVTGGTGGVGGTGGAGGVGGGTGTFAL